MQKQLGNQISGVGVIAQVLQWGRLCRLEALYGATALVAGIVLIFADRRPSRYDFDDHWNRVLQIISGDVLPTRNPEGDGFGAISENGKFIEFNNTAINSPFAYFPSLLSHGSIRIASLFTLLVSVALTVLAIHVAGKYRSIIFSTAILPTFFLQSIYPTADAMTDAFGLLFIAHVLHIWQQSALRKRDILISSILAICLGQLKITCAILILLLGVPFFRFLRKTPAKSFLLVIPAFLCAVSLFFWNANIRTISPAHGVAYSTYQNRLHSLLRNPLSLLTSLGQTFIQPLDTTGESWDTARNAQFFLGSETTQLPATIMIFVLVAICLLIIRDNRLRIPLYKEQIAIIAITVVMSYIAVCAAMLASWGIGGYAHGIQSRYFILVLPLLGLLIPDFSITIGKYVTMNRCIVGFIELGYVGLLLAHVLPF